MLRVHVVMYLDLLHTNVVYYLLNLLSDQFFIASMAKYLFWWRNGHVKEHDGRADWTFQWFARTFRASLEYLDWYPPPRDIFRPQWITKIRVFLTGCEYTAHDTTACGVHGRHGERNRGRCSSNRERDTINHRQENWIGWSIWFLHILRYRKQRM